ncbi:MAG: MiaB/RimO family radical SAM methylthiotransferase [Gemmatimonadota bacterium]|jgi:tRNA-2-methylthio-N6-dimethylallyladenosine synthase
MEPPRRMMHGTRERKKAYVETYGCQMNVADGELMQGILAAQGYDLAATPDEADVILVNTCAIREHAEQRVLGRVAQLNKVKLARPGVVLGVTGCMAQRMGHSLLEKAPYVDLVMGPDGYRRLPEVLAKLGAADAGERAKGSPEAGSAAGAGAEARSSASVGSAASAGSAASGGGATSSTAPSAPGRRPLRALPVLGVASAADAPRAGDGRIAILDFEANENYEGLQVRRGSKVSAWVPIQRGCNYRCTYCIVPYVRGPEKNRDPQQILAEVRDIVAQGIPEVVLLGQTVNSYRHGDWDFPRLLREVARVDGIRRVRFTSPHPNDVTPELVEVMAEEPTVCKHLHLPVQSGHNRTLKRMLRRYTVEAFLEKVRMVREAIPDIALSTDVIVAFPGETEEEYEATLDLMRTVRFDDAYLYKYSAREGTPATRLPAEQFIPEDVAQARLERIIEIQRAIQAEINASEVGRVEEVLVERLARSEGDVLGRTDRNKMVVFPGDASLVGRFVRVELTDTTGATFIGHRVGEEALLQTA